MCIRDREKDERAKAVLESVFPGREVVMLDTYCLNLFGGGVHCWTKNLSLIHIYRGEHLCCGTGAH